MPRSKLVEQDLNLLVSLHALLSERHVSRAAARLGISQPAMSRALSRLRDMFEDPLLVRGKSGMEPTSRALELYPQIEALIRDVREIVRPVHFDPAEATGQICIAAPDIVAYMLLPALLRRLAVEAPGLDVEIRQWSPNWRRQLEEGTIDLTVGIPGGSEPNLHSRPLIETTWVCILRSGHPALAEPWTVEHFVALDHILVTLTGRGGGPIDAVLAAQGLSRRIAIRVPYPLLTPLLVAETDCVLTTSEWLAAKLAPQVGLCLRPPPLPVPSLRAPMVWHRRSHGDPRHRWFRRVLAELAAEQTQA